VGPHRLLDICTELGSGGRAAIQSTSLIVGAHLSRSFGNYYHSFQGSPAVDLTHVESGKAIVPEIRFHLTANILDYKDLDTSWEEQIKSRLVRARPPSLAGPAALTRGSENGSEQSHDIFISHAREDKRYCGPLVEALEKAGIRVWFDKTAPKWGDDLRSTIDRGLSNCRYGIVIFSKAFLRRKKWTEYELSSLFALEKVSEKRILPIWHGVTHEDLLEYSAGLADRLAKVSSSDSYEDIVNSLCEMLGRALPDAPHKVHAAAKVEPSEGPERIRSSAERTRTVAPANYRPEILPSPFHTRGDLSPKEIELLWSAAKDPGEILHNKTLDGESIRVNGRQFLAGVDARTGAEWVAAFRKLQERGYIER
jgi:TIR domain